MEKGLKLAAFVVVAALINKYVVRRFLPVSGTSAAA